jgi:hypothetical protein
MCLELYIIKLFAVSLAVTKFVEKMTATFPDGPDSGSHVSSSPEMESHKLSYIVEAFYL